MFVCSVRSDLEEDLRWEISTKLQFKGALSNIGCFKYAAQILLRLDMPEYNFSSVFDLLSCFGSELSE